MTTKTKKKVAKKVCTKNCTNGKDCADDKGAITTNLVIHSPGPKEFSWIVQVHKGGKVICGIRSARVSKSIDAARKDAASVMKDLKL